MNQILNGKMDFDDYIHLSGHDMKNLDLCDIVEKKIPHVNEKPNSKTDINMNTCSPGHYMKKSNHSYNTESEDSKNVIPNVEMSINKFLRTSIESNDSYSSSMIRVKYYILTNLTKIFGDNFQKATIISNSHKKFIDYTSKKCKNLA